MPAVDCSLPAPRLARSLLGCRLRLGAVEAEICETEAYQGTGDRACHAAKGRTERTAVMFGPPGHLYVYLCYGLHHLLNIVCDAEGVPAAVLVRGLRVLAGRNKVVARRGRDDGDRLLNGPAKLTQGLGIDLALNGRRLGARTCPLRLLVRRRQPTSVRAGPRVGVDYAGEPWASMPWRFWVDGFPVA